MVVGLFTTRLGDVSGGDNPGLFSVGENGTNDLGKVRVKERFASDEINIVTIDMFIDPSEPSEDGLEG